MRAAARQALRAEGAESAEVSILLADDPTVHALNRDYRHQDKPTDVLSFSQRESRDAHAPPPPAGLGPEILGDVVISVDAAARQAQQFGVTLEDELALLAVHGILHLLGEEDETEEGAERMRTKETAVLAATGIASRRSGTPETDAEPR